MKKKAKAKTSSTMKGAESAKAFDKAVMKKAGYKKSPPNKF